MLTYLRLTAAVGLLALVALLCWQSSQIKKWHHQFDSEHAGRLADRASYVAAQAAAAEKNKADIARIEAKRKADNEALQRTTDTRLADLPGKLRNEGPAAAKGPASVPGLPQGGNPASGPDGTPGLCLSPQELLRAAQDEERHDGLIDWVEQQSKVDVNR